MGITDLTGTKWRFNDAPTNTGYTTASLSMDFTINNSDTVYRNLSIAVGNYFRIWLSDDAGFNTLILYESTVSNITSSGWSNGNVNLDSVPPTITFLGGDGCTDANFIAWLEANATQIIETPKTVITYNGETIASLEAGQTATIKTAETEVEHNIVVVAGSGGGAAKPILQEKTATENGVVLPDRGYDGLSKVTVDVQNSGGGGGITTSAKSQKSESRYVSTQMGAITTTATVSVA